MNRRIPLSTRIAPFALFAGIGLFALPAMSKDTPPQADPAAVQQYLNHLEAQQAAARRAQAPAQQAQEKRGSIANVVDTVATRTPSGSMVNGIEGFLQS